MKPRTLARIAMRNIESGKFIFDCQERKDEAIRQIKNIVSGPAAEDKSDHDDPIVEFHVGVYIPNFDYPIVPENNGEPMVWREDGKYMIPGAGSHTFKGIGLSGESYYMGYLDTLSPYRNAIIKADRYTTVDRAAYAFLCTMTRVLDKAYALDHMVCDYPLKVEHEVLVEKWSDQTTQDNIKEFEDEQKHLYVKWLQKWIVTHGTNPDTHMRVLRLPKN